MTTKNKLETKPEAAAEADAQASVNEAGSSFGDPSEVPDPKVGQTPTRRGDKRASEKEAHMQGSSKKPKIQKVSEMLEAMKDMEASEFDALYSKVFNESTDEEEVEREIKTIEKIKPEDLDLSEDLGNLFRGSELAEETQSKIKTIFEAAVLTRINEEIGKVAIDILAEREAMHEEIESTLSEKLDSYMDYVVTEWMDENKIAVDRGIRAEMVEDFMSGLKVLFTEHYVDIPEDKVDVVEELADQVDSLTAEVSKLTDKNVALSEQNEELLKSKILDEVTEGLTATAVEKIRTLAENVSFENANQYADKLGELKENFTEKKAGTKSQVKELSEEAGVIVDDNDDPVNLEEEVTAPAVEPSMQSYMSAISRTARK